jgi:hypothetical protein
LKVINHGIFNLIIDRDIACMDFNPEGDRYPAPLVVSSWHRELMMLRKVKKYSWAPEIENIDYENRKIFFKWYDNTCEEKLSRNWKTHLATITNDLHIEEIYKPNFYMKYFYVDNFDQMHSYAFYSSSFYIEQPINMEFYRPILNADRERLVDTLLTDGKLDMKILIKQAFTNYIQWPDDELKKIYEKIYS